MTRIRRRSFQVIASLVSTVWLLRDQCSNTSNYNNRREWFLANPNEGRFDGRIYSSDEGGTQSYNGTILALQRRFAAGSSVSANYTWSHCIGDIQNPEAGNIGYADKYNRGYDRGNCQLVDRRQLFSVSGVAAMPQFASSSFAWSRADGKQHSFSATRLERSTPS